MERQRDSLAAAAGSGGQINMHPLWVGTALPHRLESGCGRAAQSPAYPWVSHTHTHTRTGLNDLASHSPVHHEASHQFTLPYVLIDDDTEVRSYELFDFNIWRRLLLTYIL